MLGQSMNFTHFGVNEGLSDETITCIYQDSFGYLWFGTEDGLNRYDGRGFKTYYHKAANRNSLPAIVKSRILTNTLPTKVKEAATGGT